MCFGGGKPSAPINRPTYAAQDADGYFDVTMEDTETNKVTRLSKRSAEENEKATAGKT